MIKKKEDDYWTKRKKMTKALMDSKIKSAHVPFRNLEKFVENWKTDKLDVVEMKIGGSYSRKRIQGKPIVLLDFDDLIEGGFSIKHASHEIFRWDRVLKPCIGCKTLDILTILRKLQLPRHVTGSDGKDLRITPSTLFVEHIKLKLKEQGVVFQLRGKIPRGLLKEQAKKHKAPEDKDRKLVVLDVQDVNGDGIHSVQLLKQIGDAFPKNMLFYRVCEYEEREGIIAEISCKEIWNSGDAMMGGI